MDDVLPRWVRLGIGVLLAAPQLLIGGWTLLAPDGWFDSFPVLGDAAWVAADGPYNEHLTRDAGAGFLATGVALLLAALWGVRRPAVMALSTYLVFSLPHALFHSVTEVDALSDADRAAQAGSLWSGVAMAVVLLVGATRSGQRPVTIVASTPSPT